MKITEIENKNSLISMVFVLWASFVWEMGFGNFEQSVVWLLFAIYIELYSHGNSNTREHKEVVKE